MSADPAAVLTVCPDCTRLRQTVQYPARRAQQPSPEGAPHPLSRLARHLANRHLDLVPGWFEDCDRCMELSAALGQAADRGLLGAGAAQAGAEHRALHLLTSPDAQVR
ncbi:hypothetical protein ACIQUQ_05020 [Streptomyces sp. NPDC101118]|uniref:hypothetical protein n=1 Tax=Streptomyces sp. NPDC101118 TaxID=3366109 RepID=UPI00380CE0A5